ncbi:ABC transporter permease [Kineococcus rhizosphaerae]|uniref:ABC-2 type transport system permease protein n=1 Tax=Kineococcus rhizosphaerae TaxID=559628 RepID=A0A2T0R829_9ACTN|nr:ABC transporter permease [Kineococcus rhizosphaerae]PRY17312.1 ABC-2 type transport system permease protein [Kineococcus rhizosphaerae]
MSTTPAAVTSAPAPGVPRGLVNPVYVRLDVKRVLRNRRTLIFTVVMPIVFYFAFGASQSSADAKGYVMLSFAVYGAMVAATSVGASVAVERASGWSRQLRLTPMRPATYVASKVIAAASIAFVPVVVELVIGAVTGARMPARAWVIGGLVAWIGSLVFAALGLAIGYLVPSENAMQVMGPVLALLALMGGLFVPISLFSHGLQTVASFTPAYGVGILAHWGLEHSGSFVGAVANLVVWTVLFGAAAAWLFRRDTGRV